MILVVGFFENAKVVARNLPFGNFCKTETLSMHPCRKFASVCQKTATFWWRERRKRWTGESVFLFCLSLPERKREKKEKRGDEKVKPFLQIFLLWPGCKRYRQNCVLPEWIRDCPHDVTEKKSGSAVGREKERRSTAGRTYGPWWKRASSRLYSLSPFLSLSVFLCVWLGSIAAPAAR